VIIGPTGSGKSWLDPVSDRLIAVHQNCEPQLLNRLRGATRQVLPASYIGLSEIAYHMVFGGVND
jgi:hypothetical protein